MYIINSWSTPVIQLEEIVVFLLQQEAAKEDDKLLTLDGFMNYVSDKVKQDVRVVWQGLLACGYDLHFDR